MPEICIKDWVHATNQERVKRSLKGKVSSYINDENSIHQTQDYECRNDKGSCQVENQFRTLDEEAAS